MNEDYIQDYIKAGKAVIAAKKLAKEIIHPGASFLEIANKCEEEIIKNGAKLSFPINMSLDEIAAHYSPPIDDDTLVPERGLLKIDLGSHFNGYIADSAFTVNIDGDPKLQNYIDAAEAGLEAAIALFKPGTKLYELGGAIEDKIKSYDLKPIRNLGGHELKQYNLHAGPFIPNYMEKSHNQILKPGDAFACEPFATSGEGLVENGDKAFIYRFVKKLTKNIPYDLKNYMNKIENNFRRLPFSPRWIENNNLIPKKRIMRIIDDFLRKKILDNYPILLERARKPVAQQEHTIVIDKEGNTIVTTKE
ncbi:MAG: type II methionyl aminopeptidase [Promethearchaeota archaeon]